MVESLPWAFLFNTGSWWFLGFCDFLFKLPKQLTSHWLKLGLQCNIDVLKTKQHLMFWKTMKVILQKTLCTLAHMPHECLPKYRLLLLQLSTQQYISLKKKTSGNTTQGQKNWMLFLVLVYLWAGSKLYFFFFLFFFPSHRPTETFPVPFSDSSNQNKVKNRTGNLRP